MSTTSTVRGLAATAGDALRTAGALAIGLPAIAAMSIWHRATSSVGGLRGVLPTGRGSRSAGVDRAGDRGGLGTDADGRDSGAATDGRESAVAADGRAPDGESPADVVEHELGWYRYVQAFDAHHGPGGSPERDPASGSFLRGLRIWIGTRLLRGYTLENEVYVCPHAPRVLRVHQAGHAPAFGRGCETLERPRRENGGLDDEPLRTLDVMLPGDFPHTLLRLRDPRGLGERYDQWLAAGRIRRVLG